MTEDWRVKSAANRMKIVRYLLAMADEKGHTHGEKHHIHEVMGMVLIQVMADLGEQISTLSRNIDPTPPSDIPL